MLEISLASMSYIIGKRFIWCSLLKIGLQCWPLIKFLRAHPNNLVLAFVAVVFVCTSLFSIDNSIIDIRFVCIKLWVQCNCCSHLQICQIVKQDFELCSKKQTAKNASETIDNGTAEEKSAKNNSNAQCILSGNVRVYKTGELVSQKLTITWVEWMDAKEKKSTHIGSFERTKGKRMRFQQVSHYKHWRNDYAATSWMKHSKAYLLVSVIFASPLIRIYRCLF